MVAVKAPVALDRLKLRNSFSTLPPQKVRWGFHPSPVGPLVIGITDGGAICCINFARSRKAAAILKEWAKKWPETSFVKDPAATGPIARRLFGKGSGFKLYIQGTPFQQSVWKEMLKISAGKTASYAEIARRIRRPKAVRAVGTACGANPVPVLVPCHRVVASNGGLGGFSGGLAVKKDLLRGEHSLPLKAAARKS